MFERIVSKANDVVMIAEIFPGERQFRITYVNEAFTRIFGYPSHEVIGQSPRILTGPGTDSAMISEISEAIHAGIDVRRTILNYGKDGSALWMELSIVCLQDNDGRYTHFAAIERDVTAQVIRERELVYLAHTDPLTKLLNRRAFGRILNCEIGNAEVSGLPLSAKSLAILALTQIW